MPLATNSPVATSQLTIALIGNPNTGKTTLFNAMTGLRQKVGNYPGVTIDKKIGMLPMPDGPAQLVDLPGTYSLSASSPDERVAVDVLAGKMPGVARPDAIICVVDATNLLRNLFLASQMAELGLPMVIALNQMDSADKRGLQIDTDLLSQRLGVPVVSTVGRKGSGVKDLPAAVSHAIAENRCFARTPWPEVVDNALAAIKAVAPADNLSELEARRMLFDADSAVLEREGETDALRRAINDGREDLRSAGYNPYAAEALIDYEHLQKLVDGVVTTKPTDTPPASESIDHVLLHRAWGLVFFVAMMFLVFQSVYSFAGPLMDIIEAAQEALQGLVSPWFASMPMLQSLVTDGIIGGVGAFVIFLPQILILFFFIALLEDTGYMARAAFLMDKLFGWCGLNGKSFVPLLSSYACAIPGILAARTISDPKARLVTIMVAPFMSCSARLPVYVLLIAAFIQPIYGNFIAGVSFFVMHIVGLAVAIPVAFVLTRFVLKVKPQPFVMELPSYQVPRVRDVLARMFTAGKDFVIRAGTVIMAITVIVWALLYFPRPESVAETITVEAVAEYAAANDLSVEAAANALANDEAAQTQLENRIEGAYLEQSLMGRASQFVQPVFAPAGFDWTITAGVLSSFPAREVIVATLGTIHSLGSEVDEESEDLRGALARATWPEDTARAGQPIFTIPVAFAIMVFFALCQQCGATVAVIKKELGWTWAGVSFFGMTAIAWAAAVLVYQIGTALSA